MARARRGRGEGAVFQRADGQWTGSVSLGFNSAGKRVRRTFYGVRKADVLLKMEAAKNGTLPRARGVTVGTFVRGWLDGQKDSIEPTTFAQYDGHLRNHIDRHIGGVRLAALDASGVVEFVHQLKLAKVSAATTRKIVGTLRAALADAVAADIIPKDPAAKVPLPKHSRPTVRVLSPVEVQQLLTAAKDTRLESLLYVAIDSGLRQGELFGMKWGDYDAATGAMTVTRAMAELNGKLWEKVTKTAGSRRRVILSFAKQAMEEHRARMAAEGRDVGPDGLIFPDTEGKPLRKSNYTRRVFDPLVEKAGLTGFTFHGLRHCTASLMLLAGVDTKVVSSRLGHGSVGFTANTYQHLIGGLQERAAESLANVLNPPSIGYNQATNGGSEGSKPKTKKPRKS